MTVGGGAVASSAALEEMQNAVLARIEKLELAVGGRDPAYEVDGLPPREQELAAR